MSLGGGTSSPKGARLPHLRPGGLAGFARDQLHGTVWPRQHAPPAKGGLSRQLWQASRRHGCAQGGQQGQPVWPTSRLRRDSRSSFSAAARRTFLPYCASRSCRDKHPEAAGVSVLRRLGTRLGQQGRSLLPQRQLKRSAGRGTQLASLLQAWVASRGISKGGSSCTRRRSAQHAARTAAGWPSMSGNDPRPWVIRTCSFRLS